ncbi:hypothetical protein Q3G72_029358 [Acer saccharum]|nr:hypothetical protein Q3G72_029358 [Acer saccharum]
MLVSNRHNGIFNAMEAIFPDVAHGICVYHLAQNLKRFCKQRDDVMWLYYCAAPGNNSPRPGNNSPRHGVFALRSTLHVLKSLAWEQLLDKYIKRLFVPSILQLLVITMDKRWVHLSRSYDVS